MLRLKTDLNKINRFDVEAPDNLVASGVAVTGTWVVKEGDLLALPTAGDIHAMQVFTESNRDGTAGWSPDVTAIPGSRRLTVLVGKYRATTDQYTGTPSAGDPLEVDADGKLKTATKGDNTAVAVCTKAPHTERHLQADSTVIEFVTL
jgi:hypothetical protein